MEKTQGKDAAGVMLSFTIIASKNSLAINRLKTFLEHLYNLCLLENYCVHANASACFNTKKLPAQFILTHCTEIEICITPNHSYLLHPI